MLARIFSLPCRKKAMSKTTLILFWVLWLLNVLAALMGHREFIMGMFGRYAAPTPKYIALWVGILAIMLAIICISLYLKNHGRSSAAITVVAIPLVLALPYILWIGAVIVMGGKNAWR